MSFAFSMFYSCENSEQLGLELTPPGERFAYHTDTSTNIRMSSLRQDSLTSEKRSAALIGEIRNATFGTSRASLLTQLRLSSNDVDFGDDIKLDSAVLLLKYLNSYGDTTITQNLRVYEMTDDLYFDSVYYSNMDISSFYDPSQAVAEYSYLPAPGLDSLAIRLDESIGLKILEADTSHLVSNTEFLEYFKGLYIESASSVDPGAVIYFDLVSGESRLCLYYSNSVEDSLQYDVLINKNCTWVNIFDHDYTGSEVFEYINDSINDHELVYIQAMAGLRAGIELMFSDSLLAMADAGIAINKAELVFPIDESYNQTYFHKPVSLSVYGANSDGTNEFIDDIFLGESYYGGTFKDEQNAYVFNIARYIQRVLDPAPENRIENKGLFLVINNARVSADQLVLKNNQNGIEPHLSITYTIIK